MSAVNSAGLDYLQRLGPLAGTSPGSENRPEATRVAIFRRAAQTVSATATIGVGCGRTGRPQTSTFVPMRTRRAARLLAFSRRIAS